MDTNVIPSLVLLPLLAGFILPLVPRKREVVSDLIALVVAGVLVVLSVLALNLPDTVYQIGGWKPPIGINFVLDGTSRLMVIIVSVVTFAVTLYSPAYMTRFTAKRKFYSLFFLMVAGMNGVVLTGDLFNLFVFLEIASIASYALVAFGGEREELEASFRYLVLGSVASSMLLLGIALLYAKLGTVNMAHLSRGVEQLHQQIAGNAAALTAAGKVAPQGSSLVIFATVLFICGLGLKAALVPFHAWLPDAHPSAPTPISAMLSGLLIKVIGVYALMRILFTVIGMTPAVSSVLMFLGTVSMIVGVFLAVGQWDYKRLLAYHSVSQIGYVVLGIGLATPLGVAAGLFHLLNHALFKSLLFLNAGAVEYRTGTRQLGEMGGLNKRMPVTGATSFVASMSIAGIPPFNGFFSKFLIIVACFQAGRWGYALAAVVVSVLTLASFMKVHKYAYFGALKEKWQHVREAPAMMLAAMVLLAVLCLGTSVLALDLLNTKEPAGFLGAAQRGLTERQAYVDNVLGAKQPATPADAASPVGRTN